MIQLLVFILTSNFVLVTWTAPAEDAEHGAPQWYNVFVSDDGENFNLAGGTEETSFSLEEPDPGACGPWNPDQKSYWFVVAYNSYGASDRSEIRLLSVTAPKTATFVFNPSPSGTNVLGYNVWTAPPPGLTNTYTLYSTLTNGLPTASTNQLSFTMPLDRPFWLRLTATNWVWGIESPPNPNPLFVVPALDPPGDPVRQ